MAEAPARTPVTLTPAAILARLQKDPTLIPKLLPLVKQHLGTVPAIAQLLGTLPTSPEAIATFLTDATKTGKFLTDLTTAIQGLPAAEQQKLAPFIAAATPLLVGTPTAATAGPPRTLNVNAPQTAEAVKAFQDAVTGSAKRTVAWAPVKGKGTDEAPDWRVGMRTFRDEKDPTTTGVRVIHKDVPGYMAVINPNQPDEPPTIFKVEADGKTTPVVATDPIAIKLTGLLTPEQRTELVKAAHPELQPVAAKVAGTQGCKCNFLQGDATLAAEELKLLDDYVTRLVDNLGSTPAEQAAALRKLKDAGLHIDIPIFGTADTTGTATPEANMKLAQERQRAVIAELTKRLQAHKVGDIPLSDVIRPAAGATVTGTSERSSGIGDPKNPAALVTNHHPADKAAVPAAAGAPKPIERAFATAGAEVLTPEAKRAITELLTAFAGSDPTTRGRLRLELSANATNEQVKAVRDFVNGLAPENKLTVADVVIGKGTTPVTGTDVTIKPEKQKAVEAPRPA